MSNNDNALLLHPITKLLMEKFLASPSHALLITGEAGSGKRTIGMALASKILEIAPRALDSYPYFTHISKSADQKDISVDTIRSLIKSLQLKSVGRNEIRRIVLIEDAHNMSLEAQNSLLKILEEPVNDALFILTTVSEHSLLPTITSRARTMPVVGVNLNDAQDYFSSKNYSTSIESTWQLSDGNAGLMSALINEHEQHPLKEAVISAKHLIRQSPYERLISLEGISRDKAAFKLLLDALNRVIVSLHRSSIFADNLAQQRRLLSCRQLIKEVSLDIASNANPRLSTIYLAMNLSV